MTEKQSLSKIEIFALQKAREAMSLAQSAFQEIVIEVFVAHGIEEKDSSGWNISPDLKYLVYLPKREEKKPGEPDK